MQRVLDDSNVVEDNEYEVQKGDIVNIDFVGKIKKKEFEGGKRENLYLRIGSEQFIGDFEDQLIGLKVNDKKKIIIDFPEDYPFEDLKGAKVDFVVKINQINTISDTSGKSKLDA